MEAWEKFRSFVSEKKLIEAGDRVVLAVSGGPDSVCLAHMFWRLKKTMPIDLTIVNMDHGLRAESSKEAKRVEKLGKKLSLRVVTKKIGVREAADSGKISLETAGRNLRYETLFSVAEQMGFNKIATGHTANDNAETVLMWLIRGTGSEGLAGIPAERTGPGRVRVIRPMLPVTRKDVMEYVKRQKLPFSMDSSNLTLDYTRNRIRHKVIPVLNGFNPRFVEHIFNLSGIIAIDNDYLGRISERAARRISRTSGSGITLDLKGYFGYNEAVQQRILKDILPENISLRNIVRLRDLIASENRREIQLSKQWRIEKRGGRIFFRKNKGAAQA